MNIFEMLGTLDLECLNISSSTGDMDPPMKKRLGKEIVEGNEEGAM